MDSAALGKKINAARKEQGLTGERLSEMCNINATYLRQIEGGTKTPSLPVFVTICQQLHVSPHYLLSADLETVKHHDNAQLHKLLESATPKQTDLIFTMIQAALEVVGE